MRYKADYDLEKDRGDIGYDLRSIEDIIIKPMETKVIPTGVAIEFDQGIYANARGRSGLASRGILCQHGLVDSGYRGEIGVVLTNLSGKDFKVVKGDRVAQLEFRLETRVTLRRDKSISKDTMRGDKGFGSSGR